jgi:hypothetical protein
MSLRRAVDELFDAENENFILVGVSKDGERIGVSACGHDFAQSQMWGILRETDPSPRKPPHQAIVLVALGVALGGTLAVAASVVAHMILNM